MENLFTTKRFVYKVWPDWSVDLPLIRTDKIDPSSGIVLSNLWAKSPYESKKNKPNSPEFWWITMWMIVVFLMITWVGYALTMRFIANAVEVQIKKEALTLSNTIGGAFTNYNGTHSWSDKSRFDALERSFNGNRIPNFLENPTARRVFSITNDVRQFVFNVSFWINNNKMEVCVASYLKVESDGKNSIKMEDYDVNPRPFMWSSKQQNFLETECYDYEVCWRLIFEGSRCYSSSGGDSTLIGFEEQY